MKKNRTIAENAAAQLQRLEKLCTEAKAGGFATKTANTNQVLAALKAKVGPAVAGNSSNTLPLAHIAGI